VSHYANAPAKIHVCELGGQSHEFTTLTLAPILFGTNVGWLMLGVILVQAYTYNQQSGGNDSTLFKAYVYSCILLQIGETVLESILSYMFLVDGWGNPIVDSCASDYQPLFNAVSGALVQNYFAWRIRSFSNAIGGRTIRFAGIFINFLIVLLSLVAVGAATALPVLLDEANPRLLKAILSVVALWTSSSTAVDVLISICMLFIIYHTHTKMYYSDARGPISRISRLTIRTGAFTAALALAVLIPCYTEQVGKMYTFPCYLLGKSYVMSLLANLNARIQSSSAASSTPPSKKINSGGTGSVMLFAPRERKEANMTHTSTGRSQITTLNLASDDTPMTASFPKARSWRDSLEHSLNESGYLVEKELTGV